MGVAALISWLVTAFFGLDLLAVWLIEYDVTGEDAPASRLPTPVIVGHALLALTGVGVLGDPSAVRRCHTRLGRGGDPGGHRRAGPDHVHPVDPGPPGVRGGRIGPGSLPADFGFPAEREFPVSVVAGHGVLAVATVTRVLLTMLKADWPRPRGGAGPRAGVVPAAA
jgi:hypothetical protein